MDAPDPTQTAHLAPRGPAEAAGKWFTAVVDNADLQEAWAHTDQSLRLALVQSWLLTSRASVSPEDRDALAADLASGRNSPGWHAFATWRLARWRSGIFEPFVTNGWGIISVPELVAPDVEFVRIAVGDEPRQLRAHEAILAQTLTVRHVEGAWYVAGIGRTMAIPGWPPREKDLPTDYGA